MNAEAVDPKAKSSETKYRLKIGTGYLLAADGSIAELSHDEIREAFNKRFPAGCYVGTEGTVTTPAAVITKRVKHDN